MPTLPRLVLALVIAALRASFGLVAAAAEHTEPLDFNRQVRPILSQHCFKCHGPDEVARQASLRLDLYDGAVAAADSGLPAIAPGRPEESELVRRINADESEIMPPVEANKPLSAEQKAILARWISEGAKYAPHWAFVPPVAAPLPEVKDGSWAKNGIDRFILARLESAGLSPNEPADPYTLARRVHLDLTGIPPTIDEAEAFARDPSDVAYEKMVDSLLASPRYGERWARRWLDLARYADTNGYEKDRPRSIWPYRDWVISALNADMPFDRFTIEQLAGDMLPAATLDQRVATGFHRNTMRNEEGGIDPLEFRFHSMTDRVATTGTVWLGLTIGCAQCHTHKYDPITHVDYYRFMAMLNNIDEPEIDLPSKEVSARRVEVAERIAKLEAELPARFPALDLPATVTRPAPPARKNAKNRAAAATTSEPYDPIIAPLDDEEGLRRRHLERKFADWLAAERAQAVEWIPLVPTAAHSDTPILTILDDGSILATGDFTKRDIYEVNYEAPRAAIAAIRLEAIPDERLPKNGPGAVAYEGPIGDFFLSELTLSLDGHPVKFTSASHSYAKNSIGSGEASAAAVVDGDPRTGWAIGGGQGKPHTAVFHLDRPMTAADVARLELLFEKHYAAGLGRFRVSYTSDTRPTLARAMPVEVEQLLRKSDDELSAADRALLLRQFTLVAPELAAAREEIETLRAQMPELPTTLVMAERPAGHERPTFRHHRGEYLQPKEQVAPGSLPFLHAWSAGADTSRLNFARWLVDPRNPLVGRVTMNRQWATLFGRGLVRTTEDFGYQGEAPSHPELLDWLAVEFVEQGWSLKVMHRLIVTSATYRQSSRTRPEAARRDPENLLLSHAPRVRLEAELVRDAALAASGLLSAKIGGPSVFPPQPANITTEGAYGALAWNTSAGEDRYRRGLYTFMKRTAPYAMFTTFDAPSGEACVPRREISDTPLQALTLLNDAVFVEAAQALARLAAERKGDDADRATYLFQRCLARPPTADELAMLVAFHAAQRERFVAKELDAAAVSGCQERDPIDRAAWTTVARAILNLDEMVTKN